jgi:hypothetical protein
LLRFIHKLYLKEEVLETRQKKSVLKQRERKSKGLTMSFKESLKSQLY